jgi:hypothetical protein
VASFESVVAEHFPGSLREPEFVERSSRLLMEERGFLPTNTLACVGVCYSMVENRRQEIRFD